MDAPPSFRRCKDMKKSAANILSLSLISAIIAVLLAITNTITAPIIKEQEKAAVNSALAEVMPSASEFTPVDISSLSLDSAVTEVYKANTDGYVIKLKVTGYAPNMTILCGVDTDGKITGSTCISGGETLGYEKTYGDKFVGLGADDASRIDTIASATKTTAAYKHAISIAISTAKTLSQSQTDAGGSNR